MGVRGAGALSQATSSIPPPGTQCPGPPSLRRPVSFAGYSSSVQLTLSPWPLSLHGGFVVPSATA